MASAKSTSAAGNSGSTGVPELIWLRPERTGRGPTPAHSREAIAAAAIALADAEGIGAVAMRRVAASLGAGTMSLYNYVPKKEHLFDLMLDAIVGEYRIPDAPSGDPRADLALLAHEQLAVSRRHPWMVELLVKRPSFGPNSLGVMEFFLAALAGTDLDGSAKMEALSMLNGFVAQFAQWERANAAPAGGETWQADLIKYLYGVAASGNYPHLAATMAAGGPPLEPDAVFARSLDRLLTVLLGPT
ncbi:TetR/AcrR family transcriptional regulator [Embleya sp. NBC_00896]|uniref:TetR/AcrR family transcriptional regulator n=1 Tax=Embleya sp. NBC_00896 TaxID=2975961 RepID=UPI00386B861E|nr:TetR/AcrR family transcriptional regulator C-terminal domain-containing protein [Embleya sp. NBC_00896]